VKRKFLYDVIRERHAFIPSYGFNIMQVEEINSKISIKPLKFPLPETPHLTIEPNRTCNIRCRSCYTLNRECVKSLDEVKKEIDLAVKKRNLETITLLGGEPTLHPHIMEIIRYIKGRKLKCQLLTNGIIFLDDEGDSFLNSLMSAGIDRILLHIDCGQNHIHSDIDALRHVLFSKLEKKGVHFGLSITIYEENKRTISKLIQKYSKYTFFDGILAVLARDPLNRQLQKTELLHEYVNISHELNIEPTAYIPSNLDDNYVSWLIYFYFINANTGKTFSISPRLDRIFRKLYRLFKGHHLFAIMINSSLHKFTFLVAGLLDVISHPNKSLDFVKLLIHSYLMRSIRIHFIAIQTPPEFNYNKNDYQICYHCPDATIRNGMLTPVCLADKVNPLDNTLKNTEIQEDLYQTVYKHLGEI
jgi:organic radical activating enzyme